MEILLTSFLLVAGAEMGDKTQLLAFFLASRFKKALPILGGILIATLLNHSLSALLGAAFSQWVNGRWISIATAVLFIIFGLWILKADEDEEWNISRYEKHGPFVATTVLFFLAELGDKTQLATINLGAHYQDAFLVTVGTTLGMLVTDGAAVFIGHKLSEISQSPWIRRTCALVFIGFGLFSLAREFLFTK